MDQRELEQLYDRYFGEASRRPIAYVPWWIPLVPAGYGCYELATWNNAEAWYWRLMLALIVAVCGVISGVMWERYVDQETILQRLRRRLDKSRR